MEIKKIVILPIALLVVVILIIAVVDSYPYTQIKKLELEQAIYTDTIQFIATNPTRSIIMFPETDLNVFIENVHYGELFLQKTEIPPNQTVIIPATFDLDADGAEILKERYENRIFEPSEVKYEGIATIESLGMRNEIPFILEKTFTNQTINVG